MDLPFFQNVAIVGPGLLGASLGLAMTHQKLCGRVTGIGRTQASLDDAVRAGGVDTTTTDLAAGLADADLVVLCTPIRTILRMLPDVAAACKPGAIVTDVGSTKLSVVTTGEQAARDRGVFFVGSHPMAGSEKSGARNAKKDLFRDTTCYVTKTPGTDLRAFSRVCALWRTLGTRIVVMRPERHDRLAALVSHLPHLLAVALMKTVEMTGEDKNLIKGIIGNGFRDTTRIASGNTQMWVDICRDNDHAVRDVEHLFQTALKQVICGEHGGDEAALHHALEEAADYRDFLANR